MKPINPGNHPQKSLNECNTVSPLQTPRNIDGVERQCAADLKEQVEKSQKHISGEQESWFVQAASNQKVGLGSHANCDPMQSGHIVNDINNKDKRHIFRYAKGLRGSDEAMTDLFSDIVVIDEDGKVHPIPIVYASQERAVAWMLQENTRKDNSLVVDRLRLPALAINNSGMSFNQNRYLHHQAINWLRESPTTEYPRGRPGFYENNENRKRGTVFGVAKGIPIDMTYTLYAWTKYIEDMNQMVEQIVLKFSPIAYINVRGVTWESIVKLDSIANNLEIEPGDGKPRFIKFQFNFTVETYIPQPIRREKAVLNTKVDFFNSTNEEEITEVIARIEEGVED